MATRVIDNSVVNGCNINTRFILPLTVIAARDYNKGYFKENLTSVDIDSLETDIARKHKRLEEPTMDAAIGIADYDNNKISSRRLQLVELRMNYESTNNLKITDLTNKITHSISILGGDVRIDNEALFIFADKIKGQVKRWFYAINRGNGKGKKLVGFTVSDFNAYCLFKEDMPYMPKRDYEEKKKDILVKFSSKQWNEAIDELLKWCNEYGNEENAYNKAEASCIKSMLKDIHVKIADILQDLDAETRQYLDLIWDDYPNIFY